MFPYQDHRLPVEQRVNDLLARMTLREKILQRQFRYDENRLLEINFQNARCTQDTNLNQYVNKKRSAGKVDMVMATIDAVYLVQVDLITNAQMSWGIQVI